MHILVVNDDGPPSPHSSPYVHSLVRALQAAGHVVSTVKPTYYRPPPPTQPPAGLGSVDDDDPLSTGTRHARPRHLTKGAGNEEEEEWVLVDGTPASCVQIGLYHLFRERGPIDLVVSGPNYGRNTTAVFALSSGTLGGALEAAVCRIRAIALSFAFLARGAHDPDAVADACTHAVRVVEALVRQWPTDGSVDLYSVNVPLVPGVEGRKVLWAAVLQNYWDAASCFTEVEGSVGDEDEEEERIREGIGGEAPAAPVAADDGEASARTRPHLHFKWSPRFTDVYRSVDEAKPGNDGWTVREGYTSVTPLKANFWHAAPQLHQKELQL